MSTKLRRITICLPPALDEALLALAKAQGKPQARLIIETLNEFVPTFKHMVIIMEQANSGHIIEAKRSAIEFMGEHLSVLGEATHTINNVGKK
jgi:predicted DNA-binding protein